jgi:hypothetical protein
MGKEGPTSTRKISLTLQQIRMASSRSSSSTSSMAFLIEARIPFLDYLLVKYAVRSQSIRRFVTPVTRIALRDAVHYLIPESIRCRMEKKRFDHPRRDLINEGFSGG